MFVKLKLILLLIPVLATACTSVPQANSSSWAGFKQDGKASFYAAKYQSRQTASGERFNQAARTAAHKNLPFGSLVRVKNVENGETVIVRINDRGPFVEGRIIDLSRSAFADIADTRLGVIDVEIEVLN
ncbi:MAG: septal ring lytic transglycosylase RlpA family protein [Gammaproteobacteria bacterium]|jgi:rare lipoprotein A